MNSRPHAIGIDIGGTGIKGATVDVTMGTLKSSRIKRPTPPGGEPDDIVRVVQSIVHDLGAAPDFCTVGVCFPAAIQRGKTMSASNVSKKWIGLDAEERFERALERNIVFVNDADAAGYAEAQFGAARGHRGLVIVTTLGTGIGTALIYNGILIPNSELGHLEIGGIDAEMTAAYSTKERQNLSWDEWAKRVQTYYETLERLLWPDLIIVGGGVSKSFQEFGPKLSLRTPVVPAKFRNNAGIIGAASLSSRSQGNERAG